MKKSVYRAVHPRQVRIVPRIKYWQMGFIADHNPVKVESMLCPMLPSEEISVNIILIWKVFAF